MTFAAGETAGDRARWLRWYRESPDPAARLVCFPHAGGGASYFRDWPRWLAPSVALAGVCYPGREHRISEPVAGRMPVLADGIADALGPLLDRPLALFGHSMGAHVAYEVALRLEERHGAGAARLLVSAQRFPHDPARMHHLGDDDGLLTAFTALGGIAPHVSESPELRGMALDLLRGDMRLLRDYRPAQGRALSASVTGFAGANDPYLRPAELASWSAATHGSCEFRTFPGGHFYLADYTQDLIKEIQASLA